MKKRILFFGIKYFPSRGGSSRVAENIISQLKDEFDISIYCYKNPAAKNHIFPGFAPLNLPLSPKAPLGHLSIILFALFIF